MTTTILDTIKEYKLEEIKKDKKLISTVSIEDLAKTAAPVRKFYEAIKLAQKDGYGLIAEIKKASPRNSSNLPALRKDFMYDTYQVSEARALNADCILIIMASVSDQQAMDLEHAAVYWDMDVLIEVHDEIELERAMNLKSPMIGINNRNLKTFETSIDTTKRLSKLIPDDRLIISESGLFNNDDLESMARIGVRSFLIGESLMRQEDVKKATQDILNKPLRP